jgi:O-antigen/teichoic acid export membrane protein
MPWLRSRRLFQLKSVSRAVGSNLFFSVAAAVTQLLITFVASRILSPNDYGQYAAAGAVIAISGVVGGRGLSNNIIRSPEPIPLDITNTYIASLIISLAVALGLFLASSTPWLSGISDDAVASNLLQYSGAIVFLNLVATPAVALLRRELRTSVYGLITLSSLVVGNGLTLIMLALMGHGAWSLFFGALVGAAIAAVATYLCARPEVALVFDFRGVARTLRQALAISGLRGLETIWIQSPILLHSLVSNVYELGLLQRMHFLALLTFQLTLSSSVTVVMPVIARSQSDVRALRSHFLRGAQLLSFSSVILAIPGWVAAPYVIEIVFGQQWMSGTGIFQIGLVAGGLYAVGTLPAVFQEACGRNTDRYVVLLLTLSAFIIPFATMEGVEADKLMALFVLSAFIGLLAACIAVARWLRISLGDYVRALRVPSACGIILVLSLAYVDDWVKETSADALTHFIILAVVTLVVASPFALVVASAWKSLREI